MTAHKSRSLKTEFTAAVSTALLAVILASSLTLWTCWQIRKALLPDPNTVMLHVKITMPDGEVRDVGRQFTVGGGEDRLLFLTGPDPEMSLENASFSIESVETGASRLSPRRRAVYWAAGAAMVLLPASCAVAGVLLCALWFYRKKLAPAITALDDATRHISEQDLDFTVSCPLTNELGGLCASFEKMREALYEGNLRLWRALEERRTLMESVAHDLRNPLSIMEGLTDQLRETAAAGELTERKLADLLDGLSAATKRMERYTDSVRDLDAIEDTEVRPRETSVPDFLLKAAESVSVLARDRGLEVNVDCGVPEQFVLLDGEIYYRVLENVYSNAVRYAGSTINVSFALRGEMLVTRVSDDGPGFSDRMLRRRNSLFFTEDSGGGHLGLGLATGRLLCQKHGGSLTIGNDPGGGAGVEIVVDVGKG